MADEGKLPKIRKDGEVDRRGHSDGSKATQFAPGDGRKRPGRPKHSKDVRTEVYAIRDMPVTITTGGKSRKVSTRMAIYLKMREMALKGNLKAAARLDSLFLQFEPINTDPDLTATLLADDQEILRAWADRSRGAGNTQPASENIGQFDEAEK